MPADPAIIASNFRWIRKNTLLATVDLEIPAWRLEFRGCLWHQKGESEWLAFPGREWIDSSGARQFSDIIRFSDRAVRDRFQTAALAAVHAIAPVRQSDPETPR